MGVTQRRHSSTATASAASSAPTSTLRWSGCSDNAATEPEMRCREVSLPATSRDMQYMTTSASSSGRPSTSASTRAESRSSRGVARRDATWSFRNPSNSPTATMSASAAAASSSSEPSMHASDHRRRSARSASPTPSSSAITSTGMGAATEPTRSIRSPAARPSSAEDVTARTWASNVATDLGVNQRDPTFRQAACRGGSMCRIDPGSSAPCRSGSFISTPRDEQNRSGSRLTSRTSAYRATAQAPGA